ncbi:ATP-binding cassette domain-containing protein [Acuticoccus sp. M5D2P5]|uniref:phosphonate C-P lyase system protein PhnL n=1 Tax=Acuticoccus kalidii TaxID=2910977 RepID=UPI001F2CDFF5|nr:ATP-binding cassette domain-containing protein [Acuticoccus kalidii]MCF3936621.1 ATP-binding cassette domain-containing protein [Acuticoccus kalidii]
MTLDTTLDRAAAGSAKPAARVLAVDGLTKTFMMYHLDRRLPGFDDVSFTLAEGEFLLLSGENGAGKSTLLRTLFRTYVPNRGTALFHMSDGGTIDLARAADIDIVQLRKGEIGFVTQFLNARPRVSAEDLVAEPLVLAGRPFEAAREEARRLLGAFGLQPALFPAYPSTFSGGEQQKVNLARALIRPPRLLLLDEPTASLDRTARAALVDRLARMKAAGVAMIGVFHHPEDVAALVDRDVHLTRQKIRENADVAE